MPKSIIKNINISNKEYKLIKPYVLSFDTIKYLDSIQVVITLSDGNESKAEAVPLPGYSNETKGSILKYIRKTIPSLINREIDDARLIAAKDIEKNPFACSPLLTAIDLFDFPKKDISKGAIEFVIPVSASNSTDIEQAVINASSSLITIKIKLTGNLEVDIKCLKVLEKLNLQKILIRFDANQAYSYSDALIFYQYLSDCKYSHRVNYVEQPLKNNAWLEHAELVKLFPKVKTMLDESIVTNSDLYNAIDLKIPFVKFKLFKQGGIKELTEQINIASNHGLKVVLGNGVATWISNEIENMIYLKYKSTIFGASEANGFLKLVNEN